MRRKYEPIALASLVCLCISGAAMAQDKASGVIQGQTPAGQEQKEITVHGGMRLQAQSTAPVPNAPPVQTGWNFLHPNDCIFYDDGSGLGPILAFYSQEEQQTRYWYTYEWQFQNMLQAACSVNYWVGFYVIDSAGDWTQLATFAR